MTEVLPPRVDISFSLTGRSIPVDHGHALFGALGTHLGDIHGAKWLAVHPIAGSPGPDGTLVLRAHEAALRLRIAPAEIPRVLALSGKALSVAGHNLRVGVASVYALRPVAVLRSRLVVVKGFVEEEPFTEAVRRQLGEQQVKADVEIGRRRVISVNEYRVVGFEVTLRGLSDESSVKVQSNGVGGKHRFGCGVFGPIREKQQ